MRLEKGQSTTEVVQRLGVPPLTEHRAEVDGRRFLFYQYRMNNGLHVSHYLVAFEGQRLAYWGYLDEFRRQPDETLSRATSRIAPAVLAVR